MKNESGKTRPQKIITAVKIIGVLVLLGGLYYLLHYGFTNFDQHLVDFMKQSGFWGPLIFILFQAVQVIVPVLPGGVSLGLGVLTFGSTAGFLYNYLGIVCGSIASFCLIRKFGKRLVRNLVSEKNYRKLTSYLANRKRFTLFLTVAILIPVAPDDLLCMVAGLTNMPLKTFTAIIVFCKPFSIFAYGYLVSVILHHI